MSRYNNFVRESAGESASVITKLFLSGEEAKRLYLEEIREANNPTPSTVSKPHVNSKLRTPKPIENVSNKDLFLSAEQNDVEILKDTLDNFPEKLNIVDDFGWNLLMIACQANSVEAVKELLKRGIDTEVRDKAGNSACSLVIKNRNVSLADLLLSHRKEEINTRNSKHKNTVQREAVEQESNQKSNVRESTNSFNCKVCNNVYPDKNDHLSSTVHNISASKGKKIPPNYKIPQTNKGYQIMLKVGWDRDKGLGRDGHGNKYPIKAVQKKDRNGLGLKKEVKEVDKDIKLKKTYVDRERKSRFERNFRREFY